MEGRYPPNMAEENSTDLTDFEAGLLDWLVENNFHVEPWSTQKAAKQFYVCLLYTSPSPRDRG